MATDTRNDSSMWKSIENINRGNPITTSTHRKTNKMAPIRNLKITDLLGKRCMGRRDVVGIPFRQKNHYPSNDTCKRILRQRSHARII